MSRVVHIFLASSSELHPQRIFVGNEVRKLSDRLEAGGVRLRLNIWEDFPPEFSGERKQSEYNRQLVDKSDIVFGLFKTRCGKYTKEEILRAKMCVPNQLYCFLVSPNDCADVRCFVESEKIPVKEVSDDVSLWREMSGIIEAYVSGLNVQYSLESCPKCVIYSTVASDLEGERVALGDIVRSVDYLSEDNLGIRCQMLPMGNRNLIGQSDYYMSLFNNELDKRSEAEFKLAYENKGKSNHPTLISVFQRMNGTVTRYDSNNEVSKIMNRPGKEFFSIEYEHLDTVKANLVAHMVRVKGVLDPMTAFSLGNDNSLYLGDYCVDENYGRLLGESVAQISDFRVQVNLMDLMMPSETQLGEEVRLRSEIQGFFAMGEDTPEKVRKLAGDCKQLVTFLKRRMQQGWYKVDYVLRAMLLRVAVHDHYDKILEALSFDENKEMVDLADRYSCRDITVEDMRVNMANALSQNGREQDALALYGIARRNILAMGDSAYILRRHIMLLYYNALSTLSLMGERHELEQWLSECNQMIERWVLDDENCDYYRCYIYAFGIDILPVDELGEGGVMDRVKDYHEKIKGKGNGAVNRYDFISAVQILTKSLSRYYVDRVSIAGLPDAVRNEYVALAFCYLEQEFILDAEIMVYDQDAGLLLQAVAYHNRGFLEAGCGMVVEAVKDYSEALRIRRKLFELKPTVEREADVAETMVNIGAVALEEKDDLFDADGNKIDAESYAEQAYEIYNRLNNGTLWRETDVYKSLLLKGTSLYGKGMTEAQRQHGLAIIRQVRQWDQANPDNYYHGVICRELKRIVIKESKLYTEI